MCFTPPRFITRNQTFGAFASSVPTRPLLGALQTGVLWDHRQQIEISFMSGSSTRQQRKKTRKIFRKIFRYTNLDLRWVKNGCGHVRITFHDDIPSQSHLGTQCLSVPKDLWTINLKSIQPDTECPSPLEERTIRHECMHLLAFVHEHQVPEWPNHFLFDQSKLDEVYGGELGMSEEEIEVNITNLSPPEMLENYSPFDPKSITLYHFPSHVMQSGVGTLYNTDLSDVDKAVLVLNYARLNPGPLVPTWTVSHAADIIGIKGQWRENIVAATHPHDVRKLYSQWSASSERSQQGGTRKA